MGGTHRNGSIRKKVTRSKTPRRREITPQIFIDREADFASIKLAPGIEARSYLKDGFVFCEDAEHNVIEIQILNLSSLAKEPTPKKTPSRAA